MQESQKLSFSTRNVTLTGLLDELVVQHLKQTFVSFEQHTETVVSYARSSLRQVLRLYLLRQCALERFKNAEESIHQLCFVSRHSILSNGALLYVTECLTFLDTCRGLTQIYTLDLHGGLFRSTLLYRLIVLYGKIVTVIHRSAPRITSAADKLLLVLFKLRDLKSFKPQRQCVYMSLRCFSTGPPPESRGSNFKHSVHDLRTVSPSRVFTVLERNAECHSKGPTQCTPPSSPLPTPPLDCQAHNPNALELSEPRAPRCRQATAVSATDFCYELSANNLFRSENSYWYKGDSALQSFFNDASPTQHPHRPTTPRQSYQHPAIRAFDGVRHNAESSNDNVVFQKTYGDDDYQKARDAECSPLVLHSQPNSTSPKSSHLPRGGYVPDSEFNPSIGNSHSSDFFTLPFIRSQRTPCSNSVPITASVVAEKLYYRGLPELALLRDLLYPLQGLNGSYVKYHPELKRFLLRQDIVVSTPVRILVSRVCAVGLYYCRIQSYLEPSKTVCGLEAKPATSNLQQWWADDTPPRLALRSDVEASAEPLQSSVMLSMQRPSSCSLDSLSRRPVVSLVHEALHQFFRRQLSMYYTLLSVIENEVLISSTQDFGPHSDKKRTGPGVSCTSLRSLTLWLGELTEKFALLAAIADVSSGLKGGPLLSVIFDHSHRGDKTGRVLIADMLKHITVPWMDMVYQWVHNGVIVDPYDEFFIKENEEKQARCNQTTNYKLPSSKENENDFSSPEHLWRCGYAVQPQRIPKFISPATASKIFTCGKSIATIKRFQLLEARLDRTAIVFRPSTSRGTVSETHSNSVVMQCCTSEKDLDSKANILDGIPQVPSYSKAGTRIEPASHIPTQQNSLQKQHLDKIYHITGCTGYTSDFILANYRPLCSFSGVSSPFHNEAQRIHLPEKYRKKPDTQLGSQDDDGFRDIQEMEHTVNRLELQHSQTVVNLLLYRYHLVCHCEGIRRFLLLGQGDFVAELLTQFFPNVAASGSTSPYRTWESQNTFTEESDRSKFLLPHPAAAQNGCDLTQPARYIFAYQLRSSLQNAIASSNVQHFPEELIKRLSISKFSTQGCDTERRGWEVVSLDYITKDSPVALVLDPESIRGYRRIHSLLWRIHRVCHALNRVWLNHIRNCRRLRRRRTISPNLPQRYAAGCESETIRSDTQWAITKCEALYSEITHFLRNLQSFFMYEVIEPSWVTFVEQLNGIVDAGGTSSHHTESVCAAFDGADRLCKVDQLLLCHCTYLSSMLNGLFLDNVSGGTLEEDLLPSATLPLEEQHATTPLDILSETPCRNNRPFSSPTLELILSLLQYSMSFVIVADTVFGALYCEPSRPLDSVLLANLDDIGVKYRSTLIEFLKHLNAATQITALEEKPATQNNISGVMCSIQNSRVSTHHDAIRALLYRLDFNNFYGSDWELYRRCLSVNQDCADAPAPAPAAVFSMKKEQPPAANFISTSLSIKKDAQAQNKCISDTWVDNSMQDSSWSSSSCGTTTELGRGNASVHPSNLDSSSNKFHEAQRETKASQSAVGSHSRWPLPSKISASHRLRASRSRYYTNFSEDSDT